MRVAKREDWHKKRYKTHNSDTHENMHEVLCEIAGRKAERSNETKQTVTVAVREQSDNLKVIDSELVVMP